MQKSKISDRLTADVDTWAIRQNGVEKLSGDGLSIRMIFRNLCRMNFAGEKYDQYVVFAESQGINRGEIELVNNSQIIMKGTVHGPK